MRTTVSILLFTLVLHAPAYGASSSGFVLQDIVDTFREGYQAILRRNDNTHHDKLYDSTDYRDIKRHSRYATNGILRSKDYVAYEYVTNGVLTHIKVVPKSKKRAIAASLVGNASGTPSGDSGINIFARPYYMTPGDGSPHYSDLQHAKSLYPQWVIAEF